MVLSSGFINVAEWKCIYLHVSEFHGYNSLSIKNDDHSRRQYNEIIFICICGGSGLLEEDN